MPLYSEHISNMYYGGSPSYSSPSYSGYKSSYLPLGTSYSASYLNPGGSYSNHSSLSSYSRTPLSSRWIPGMSRSYSPILTPISERCTSTPIRINSPRRIPISKRTYGTPSYIQRPININTADIDVSRNKYSHKQPEPSTNVYLPPSQIDAQINEKENTPFMPRVDGKPETGIDSSPGMQRSTIKRGRTVVRLHTIKRKDKDSPRKPMETSQNKKDVNMQEETNIPIEDAVPEEVKELSWREKLSDDLVYVDKKAKKTLGTKLVEKFLVKDVNKKDNEIDQRDINSEEPSARIPGTSDYEIASTSKSLDRRCSMELLAEQANLLDSLIRGENLSTAPLDLSKVGISDGNKNKFDPSDSIKRRRTDDKGNPLQTTKSDHSLHDNLKSSKNSKDSNVSSKRRSLKKSYSGGSICRLDSITEFPKETKHTELPPIEEIRLSPKIDKTVQKPKQRNKITSSVEISPPTSPLKFKIENVTVEEKIRTPKKEIKFSYDVDETPIQDVTLQNPKTALKRNKEHNSKKKSKKNSIPVSPEPDDGNFWEKIGKRETIYLMKRKQNIDAEKEKKKRSFFWFPEDDEQNGTSNSWLKEENEISNLPVQREPNQIVTNENNRNDTAKEIEVDTSETSPNLEKSPSSDNVQKVNKNNSNLSLKEKVTTPLIESVSNSRLTTNDTTDIANNIDIEKITQSHDTIEKSKTNKHQIPSQVVEIKDADMLLAEKKIEIQPNCVSTKMTFIKSDGEKLTNPLVKEKTGLTDNTDMNILKGHSDIGKVKCASSENVPLTDKISVSNNTPGIATQAVSRTSSTVESSKSDFSENIPSIQSTQTISKSEGNLFDKFSKELAEQNKTSELLEANINQSLVDATVVETVNLVSTLKSRAKSESNKFDKKIKPVSEKSNTIEKDKVSDGLSTKNSKTKAKPTNISAVTTLQNQAHKKVESKLTVKVKNEDDDEKISTGSSKKNVTEEKTSINSKKKVSKAEIKVPEKTQDDKTDKSSGKICKKCLGSENSNSNVPLTLLEKETEIPTDKLIGNVEDDKNNLGRTVVNNNSNIKTASNVTAFQTPTVVEAKYIPIEVSVSGTEPVKSSETSQEIVEEENKAEKDFKVEEPQKLKQQQSIKEVKKLSPKKPIKEEKAGKTLIATPRPLQKRAPQVIHSSESSSEEESSSDEESDESEDSAEFFECENNPDGRTSTGSNDSGFDSSAPTSPASFLQIKKGGGDSPGPSSSNASSHLPVTDILEQELEQSTAYGIFRKTGRFTPPARSIPRFRKYNIEDFQFIKVLGKGSFGKVLLAELRDTEYYYAVKCLKKDVVLEDDDVECTLIERKVLALGTNHPYLCHLFATFQTDSHLFFVMEYLNGGDLMFHIQQSGRFPEARARFYGAEIVSGLKFLHKRGIVYRDLKLDNILLDFDGHVRIADFGMCKLQIYLDKTADTFCGTPDYMAPEIIKGLKYNQTVDWWSFGVLLYEMLIGQSPFSGCDEDELFWSICNEMPSYPRFLSREGLTILTRLLDKDARTRLGGTECMHGDIREQEFFHPVHWDKLERRELEAPFKPRVRHPLDTQYFDRAFTGERPRLTAVEPHVLRSMDQEPFRGFSYTNPNATDR